MRALAVSNYKRRVGNTTTAVNPAVVYAARGLRVLLIDLDSQAHTTDHFGLYDRATLAYVVLLELYSSTALFLNSGVYFARYPMIALLTASHPMMAEANVKCQRIWGRFRFRFRSYSRWISIGGLPEL